MSPQYPEMNMMRAFCRGDTHNLNIADSHQLITFIEATLSKQQQSRRDCVDAQRTHFASFCVFFILKFPFYFPCRTIRKFEKKSLQLT